MAGARRRAAAVLLLGAGALLGSGCAHHGYGYAHGHYGHGYGHYGHGYHASYHGGGDGLVVIAAVVALWYLLGDACGW
jgi:hypothetical protein